MPSTPPTDAIANAGVRAYPFPHICVESVFPTDFYRQLLEKLPALTVYKRLDESGTVAKGAYPDRYICSLEAAEQEERRSGAGDFGKRFRIWLSSDAFAHLIMYRFREGMSRDPGFWCEGTQHITGSRGS